MVAVRVFGARAWPALPIWLEPGQPGQISRDPRKRRGLLFRLCLFLVSSGSVVTLATSEEVRMGRELTVRGDGEPGPYPPPSQVSGGRVGPRATQ